MSENKEIKEKIAAIRLACLELKTSVEVIKNSGMREKTVLVLLSHYTKLPQKIIRQVLAGVENLESEYFGENETGGGNND